MTADSRKPDSRARWEFEVRSVVEGRDLAARLGEMTGSEDLATALGELLTNSIEHGNLGITYQEKSELLTRGGLETERARRLALPEHREKRVKVEVRRHVGAWEIEIHDCGPGFDWQRYSAADATRLSHRHGRGVLLACALVDVEYLAPGNRVRVRVSRHDG